ncbi:MAG TPA: MtaA/CmuA family methyltransferase [Anaerolineae bacterium]|nr:MtaA/CmuA family methyltransferase [Anaerolineae bacterium]
MSPAYAMTPKRRFLSAMLGGRVDRIPIGSPTSVATVEQMEITGAYFPEAHCDGEKMARLAAGAYEILGYDAIMPYFSVQAEAAALGCVVDWGDFENMPVERSHPWAEPEQVCIPADFLSRPPIEAVLDALRLLRAQYGHRVAVIGKVMGPWTLSYHVHGLQDFLLETLTAPAKVRGFLDRLKEVTVLFGQAQIAAGADVLCIADHATGDLVSPKMYRDFLLPYHRELTQRLGCPTVLHICGNTLSRIQYIRESGFDAFHFDSKVDALKAVEAAAGQISLIGGVSNIQALYYGTPELVVEQADKAVQAGVRIIGPECAVPLRTPLENLKAIARVREKRAENRA